MRLNSLLIVIASLLIGLSPVKAQDNDLGAWYIYNGFFKFNPKVEIFFETQWRNNEVFANPEAFFIRPYITYNVIKELQFGVSAEYHQHYSYGEDYTEQTLREEFRVDLMAILSQNVGRVKVQHRYRYEFRNINSYGGNRMRYRLQVTIPINSKNFDKGTLFINTNNEFFINNQPEWSFDQNRLYFAVGYHFTKSVNFQLGYMLVSKEVGNFNRLQIFFTHKLDFSKERLK